MSNAKDTEAYREKMLKAVSDVLGDEKTIADIPVPAVAKEIFGDRLPLAEKYHDVLATDGLMYGFMGPREVPRLWGRHILNCAVISEAIEENATVADIGSGAGLPGIPLAIARPDLQITLIEPLLKRSNFLREVVQDFGLDNVTVVRGRAEDKDVLEQLGTFDVVTSRAVAALGKLTKWSMPLVTPGGRMIALKGATAEDELKKDAAAIKKAGGVDAKVYTVGEILDEPSTVVSIKRRK